jgi:hypothetical protein
MSFLIPCASSMPMNSLIGCVEWPIVKMVKSVMPQC